jgi:protein O-mannosyl-transferase
MSRPRVLALLIVVAVAVAFGRLAGAEFVSLDDRHNVRDNPMFNPPTLAGVVHFWTRPIAGLYIPVTYTVWGALAAVAQVKSPTGTELNPAIFHVANIALHAGSALVVFALLRRLTRRDWPAAAGALVFALHPVQVEAVAWVSGMKDVLCGLLTLMALWQYVEATGAAAPLGADASLDARSARSTPPPPPTSASRRRLHYAIATAAFVLAFLAKPTAVVTPLLAAAIDFFVLRRPARQIARSVLPWVVLAAPGMILTKLAQSGVGVETGPLWTRPLVAADALAFYLYKLVVPVNFAMDYGRTPIHAVERGWVYWTWVLPAAVAVALFLNRRYPWLVAAALVFAIGVGPVLGLSRFLFQYFSTVSDHYLYLSMLGPALAVAWLLAAARRPAVWSRAAVAILLLLGGLTMAQTRHWQDDDAVWTRTLAVNPRSFMALNNRGGARVAAGDYDAASAYFARAIEAKPDYDRAHENLGLMLVQRGIARRDLAMIDQGLYHSQLALDLRAAWPASIRWGETNARLALGQAYALRGRLDEAVAQFEAVLKERPDHAEAAAALAATREKLEQSRRGERTATTTASVPATRP